MIMTRKQTLDVITYAALILGSLVMVGPFIWMISTSFKLPADQFTRALIPEPVHDAKFFAVVDDLALQHPHLEQLQNRHDQHCRPNIDVCDGRVRICGGAFPFS